MTLLMSGFSRVNKVTYYGFLDQRTKGRSCTTTCTVDQTTSTSPMMITEETSKRICAHMNEDHAVSVFAMAKRSANLRDGFSISKATLQKVTMEGCHLQVMLCRGDACRVERVIYPFLTPLSDPSEIRSRLIEVHHEACRPVAW